MTPDRNLRIEEVQLSEAISFKVYINREYFLDYYRNKIYKRLSLCKNYDKESLSYLNKIFQLSLLLEYVYFLGEPTDKYENILKMEYIKEYSDFIRINKENENNIIKINRLSNSYETTVNYWSHLQIKDFFIGSVYTDMLWNYLFSEKLKSTILDCINNISEKYAINFIPELIDIDKVYNKQKKEMNK